MLPIGGNVSVMASDTLSVAIRVATPADCTGTLKCLASAFAPYQDRYTPEAFLDTILTPETICTRMLEMVVFVAENSRQQVIGTIACKVVQAGEGHLRGMAVLPEWQGASVAKQLLEHAEQELRALGCFFVTLDTTEPLDRAMHFYERNGYRRTGRITQFFGMSLIEYRKSL